MHIKSRLRALEQRAGVGGIDWSRPCHRLIVDEGETLRDAVQSYGPERIDPRDRAVVRVIVAPKRDAAGALILQPPSSNRISNEDWEEACRI